MSADIRELGAVILFVEDLGRSRAFYHDGLGLQVEFEDEDSAGFRLKELHLILLQVDRAREQLHGEPATTPGAGATAFLATFTEDVDATYSELVERGIPFFQAPTDQPWGMRTAYLKDPDGHVWEIAQPLRRSES